MDIDPLDPLNKAGRTSWIIAIATLVAIAAAQVYQIFVATGAVGLLQQPVRKYMYRLVWVAVAVLSVDLVMMFWLTVRYLSARGRRHGERAATPYVDAWAAAGERFHVDEGDEDDDEDAGPLGE